MYRHPFRPSTHAAGLDFVTLASPWIVLYMVFSVEGEGEFGFHF
jgi:hypothetical protein